MTDTTRDTAMTTTPDYAGLIERLRSHEERWECAGGGGWETPEVCIQAATALEALSARNERLRKALDALDRMSRGVDWCDQDEQARRWAAARRALEGGENG